MNKDEEFLKRLKQIFSIEAEENLKSISDNLLELEKEDDPLKQKIFIETSMREVHSLKGSSRSVNLPEIVSICQPLESVFLKIKNNEIGISRDFFDITYESIDTIKKIIYEDDNKSVHSVVRKINKLLSNNLNTNNEIKKEVIPEAKVIIENKIKEPENTPINIPIEIKKVEEPKPITTSVSEKVINKQENANEAPKKKTVSLPSETVRISVNKLDSILFKAEEMLSVKLNTEQRVKDLQSINRNFEELEKQFSNNNTEIKKFIYNILRENNIPLSKVTRINEIFVDESEKLKNLRGRINSVISYSEQDKELVNSNLSNLLEDVKKTLMLPFSSITDTFPRMVRDISHQQSKDIDFIISGSEIEIDKRILEDIKEPLIHLLRNSIDHGLETTDERIKAKKSPLGILKIEIAQTDSNKVEVVISDNGRGINKKKIITKAIELGLIDKHDSQHLNEQEIFSLIFNSGFSTSEIITEISGRGLGMAIVKDKVEKLSGVITTYSTEGEGTTFKITLPLTLATFRGLIVTSEGRNFVIPLTNVEKTIRVSENEINTIEDKKTLSIDNMVIPIVNLRDIIRIPTVKTGKKTNYIQVVIIFKSDNKIALSVDEVLYEQEVMVKRMGKQLQRVPNIGGVTILGSGQVVPLLNVADLIKTSVNNVFSSKLVSEPDTKSTQKKSILVAEDSITSRTLLKNILETAGYNVKTTYDGAEAYTILLQERFDLIISDVEMPRMNGFELTAKIRSNEKISDIPLILITSLNSREHKEKGIEVGANAYIVKTEFEQETLLEIIPRLI